MNSPHLYDFGEENWERKLHLACGGIYLLGYENSDIVGEVRAAENFEPNLTDIKDYYARLDGSIRNLPVRRKTIVDRTFNFIDPPYEPGTVDKIVCIQALEHLNQQNAHATLARWWNILKPGGVLIVSVPRMDDTLELLHQPDRADFARRHLEGSRRDIHNVHQSWFNAPDIEWLLDHHGFTRVSLLPNFHLYPALVVRAVKADRFVPDRRYQMPLPHYDETCKTVLDVGPGAYPLPMATHCFDVNDRYEDSRRVPCDIGDVEHLPYDDNAFDYVYCSHVLEHTLDPLKALRELQRVGKRGYVEVPAVTMDFLMQHGDAHTRADGKAGRWMCLPIPGGIVFVERSDQLTDAGFNDARWRNLWQMITQYQVPLNANEQFFREFFWSHQDTLNVSASWNKPTINNARAVALHIVEDGQAVRWEIL